MKKYLLNFIVAGLLITFIASVLVIIFGNPVT